MSEKKLNYLLPHPPLIIEGIGKHNEIAKTKNAIHKIFKEIQDYNPDTIVIVTPHATTYADYFCISSGEYAYGDFSNFGLPSLKINVKYDSELANTISSIAKEISIPAGSLGEVNKNLDHATLIPIYFLKPKQIVRISISGFSLIDHYKFGMCIEKAAKKLKRKIVVIASGDMSHKLKNDGPYGIAKEGIKFDNSIKKYIKMNNVEKIFDMDEKICEKAGECGLRPITVLIGSMDSNKINSSVINYEKPYGVGYLTAKFSSTNKSESILKKIIKNNENKIITIRKNENPLVRLARENIESVLNTKKTIDIPNYISSYYKNESAGVFVCIKKNNNLRGCVGTIFPTEKNIASEVLRNSISAAFYDNRFTQIKKEELNELVYSVDILSTPEKIDNIKLLNPKKYGIILTQGSNQGVLLPDLEDIDTIEKQIEITAKKGNINLLKPYAIMRFTVKRVN
ncbi:MAG: AmmeMemoRadiSam system protein A [Mycoplasmataceae bacterium]|jgi:AmmeMemoRadiSam system protein A/AmmeMemoRadiSam system protein B|nr:AmmeMemoRadiSam system protein A [Mycoplasmataceae bacterium]